jgi:hypothetical protein
MHRFREPLELLAGTLLGVLLARALLALLPERLGSVSPEAALVAGGAAGFLAGVSWSAWRVLDAQDKRVPLYQRTWPSLRDGRPLGVLAARSRTSTLEYLMWVLAALVVVGIVALARRYL